MLIAAFAAQPAHGRANPGALAALTGREREVLALADAGLSNQ
jgi:DNA-binding CsgD family transcriptional regulator